MFVGGFIIILHMAAKISSSLLLQYNAHLGDIAKHFSQKKRGQNANGSIIFFEYLRFSPHEKHGSNLKASLKKRKENEKQTN